MSGMKAAEEYKLRYHGPTEEDWHVERLSAAEAAIRKRALEEMGCVVELTDASQCEAARARFGRLLDPKPLMN